MTLEDIICINIGQYWHQQKKIPMSTADAIARATRASFCMMTCSLVAIEIRCWTPPAFATAPTTSCAVSERQKRLLLGERNNQPCTRTPRNSLSCDCVWWGQPAGDWLLLWLLRGLWLHTTPWSEPAALCLSPAPGLPLLKDINTVVC